MKNLNNQKVFLLIIILLTLVNLGFVITVFVAHQKAMDGAPGVKHFAQQRHFMMKEVGFSVDQMKEFREFRKEFRDQTMPLHEKLKELNKELVMEATSTNPDTARCYLLSREIGDVHAELKQVTSLHMMRVREIANPGQVDKLHQLYLEMFEGDFPHQGGRQFRHRRGNDE